MRRVPHGPVRVLLALLVLAAIGAVIVVWTGAARAPKSAVPAEARIDVRPPATAASTATVANAANAADAVPAAPSAPDAHRQAVESPESEIASVRVVLASTDEAVAGARVRYRGPRADLSESDAAKLLLEEYGGGEAADREALLQRVGTEVVTDAEGRCRLPIGESETEVVARFGDLFAQGWARADPDREIVLRLRPDHALRVLVLDAAGQPAPDIPVQMWLPDAPTTREVGPTDADGRCVFHHVQRLLEAGEARSQRIVAMPPGGVSAEDTCDIAAPPPEIVLRLPATGTVTVRLRDAAGNPLDTALLADPEARLQTFDSELASRDGRRTAWMWGAHIGPNAEALFRHVALDCYLVVSQGLLLERGCPGPTAAKPHVEVTLQESQQDVILFAALRLPDTRPVAERRLRVTCRSRGDTSSREVATDAAGRMRCNFGALGTSDDCVINIASYDRQEDNDISVELAPRKVNAGVNDLGELRLAAQGLLVAGRLVREPGVPVEHVWIDFERRHGDRWQQQRRNLYPDWQPDGSFSLCSEIPAGALIRLVVRPGAYLPVDPIECKAGDRDVEIRLRAAGELTATFLVEEATPVDRLVFRLRQRPPHQMDERELDRMSRYGQSPEDGRMPRWWRGLTPGTYDLTIRCAGVAEPLASVAGLTVVTGPCTDPRLDGIDLRGRLQKFEIRVTDADGQPIADENAFVIACSSSEWSGYALGDGTAQVYATTSLDVVVTAPGCRAARFQGVTGSRTVALERAEPSAFRVAWPVPLPGGVTATLRLVPKPDLPHDDRFTLDHGSMPIGKLFERFERSGLVGRDGVCAVPVVWPGEHTIDLSLATGGRLVHLSDVAPMTVVLPAAGEIVLTVDPSGYDAALQGVRK